MSINRIYSNACRFALDGYPWTMTLPPIAFPNNPNSYGRENASDRGYEWMIGDALLATALYDNDYATATSPDVYLPAGEWMDFDTGERYSGGQTLNNFALPAGKSPLIVGGSGVTLGNREGKLLVCVYPVADHASVDRTTPEGGQPIHIEVHGLTSRKPWDGISVQEVGGPRIQAKKAGFAYTFVPQAGKSYRAQALP